MNREAIRLLSLFGLLVPLFFASAASARTLPPSPMPEAYKAALVYDYDTNEVIYQDRAHDRTDPASLVKMMVALITMERIYQGELKLDDRVKVSARGAKIGGHQVYLKQGEVFPLRDLLRAVIIASANDASFTVAEHVAGTQAEFVKLMNARARQLGMVDTFFANAHGLPANKRKGEQSNYTSAYDLALLSRELMKFREVREWAATRTSKFRNGKLLLVNTNRQFLRGFKGADGFKTGYHPRGAGFCVVATAQRDGRRLVAVVLGAKNPRNRLRAVSDLLELGFQGKLMATSAAPAPLQPSIMVGTASEDEISTSLR